MITNQIRNATVVATCDVKLAYLEEHHYRSLFKEQIENSSYIVQILQSSFLDVKKSQAAQLSQYFKIKEKMKKPTQFILYNLDKLNFVNKVLIKETNQSVFILLDSSLVKSKDLKKVVKEFVLLTVLLMILKQFYLNKICVQNFFDKIFSIFQLIKQVYQINIKNIKLPQFEIFQKLFSEYSNKTINWMNKRKQQFTTNSIKKLNLLQEQNKKQNLQSQSQERKIVQEKNLQPQPLAIFTPIQRKNKKSLTARTSRSSEKLKSAYNSKHWNKFFDAMHSMHEEQKHIRLQSQPQLKYQNSQKLVETNILFKKLQKQLQQQAPEVDLQKNDLSQIAQNIKTKGLAISPMTRTADQSMNSNRRFRSLESILQTIANRENTNLTSNGQNTNTSINNMSLLSPENRKLLSPEIINQIEFFQQNNKQIIEINNQQENFFQNIAPQSLVELGSTNQSLSSQTIQQLFSQTTLPNNIIQNLEQQNSSPISIYRQPRVFSARRVSSCNQHINQQGLRVETEVGKKISSSNSISSANFSSNQAKLQIIQQAQLSNKNNNGQLPIRQLRMQIPTGNTSLSSYQGSSSLSHLPYPGEEDTIQESKKGIQKQIENPCLSSTASSTTISNSQTLSQITTNRSQNKLNLHKSQQIISKPFQTLSSNLQVPIISKAISLQKSNNSQNYCDNSLKEGSIKLIKAQKVNDENETSPTNSSPQVIDQCSPIPFNNQQVQQFTYTTDTFPSSPQSSKTKELYIKMIQCASEQHLASDETPPSVNRKLSNKLIHKPVGSLNKDSDHEQLQLINEQSQQSLNNRANTSTNKNEMTRSLSNRSPNQSRRLKQDQIQNQKETSLANTIKNQQDLHKDVLVLQPSQSQNLQQFFVKRSINTFSDAVINSESLAALTLSQPIFHQPSLHSVNSAQQSQPSQSKIQDMANSFYINQQNLSSKFQIYGDLINTGLSKNYNCSQIQPQVQQLNSTSTRFKYLDVKGETERIQQSLLLKKQKKGQSQQLTKRKEFLEKMMASKHVNQGITSQQNSMIINSVQDSDVKYFDQNLFQKEKLNTVNSPSRSPSKYQPNTTSLKCIPIKFNELDKHQTSAVNELTEGDETTPIAREQKKMPNKSQSFSNRFINHQPSSQQYIQDNSKDYQDIISQRSNTLSDLNNFKKITYSRSIDKQGNTEFTTPIKTSTIIMTKSCKNNHLHKPIKSQSISQNNTHANITPQNFEAISPIKQISSESILIQDLLQYKKKIYSHNLNQNKTPQKRQIIAQSCSNN